MTNTKSITAEELNNLKEMARIIRGLAMDGVQKANSGHPGMPMGMADAASVLWMRHLKYNPNDPKWPDRDRFVLSAGHGSMLLYSLLHLTGFDLPLDELKMFRQWESKTPGHPEVGDTAGVETTTGPLSQGLANAVGMAIAERRLAAHYNKPGHEIVDHFTYALAGDGCLMEGLSHEACSLAGHLKLDKLIVLYDDNNISIDGPTSLSFSEDVLKRFEAYGWHTQRVDGHDMHAVDAAIVNAKKADLPSIIACKTTIGFGSPNMAGTSKVHGSPLGAEEVLNAKKELGLPVDKDFYIDEKVLSFARTAIKRGEEFQKVWQSKFEQYKNGFNEQAVNFLRIIKGELPANWEKSLPEFPAEGAMATRSASGKTLDALTAVIPELLGGSADLTPSNNTFAKNGTKVTRDDFSGNYIHYGVREHAMAAIMNGIALHGGVIPYGGTFLVFSDYMRNSVRLAAMMGIRVIFVFTHDSIGLGEDGPTHQPIEHIASLRAIPNLTVVRPADANETAQAWRFALKNTKGPTALMLTRQNISIIKNDSPSLEKGAYIISNAQNAKVLLLSSGSEVEIALGAQKILAEKGIASRVISMPSCELFDKQDAIYRESILPKEIKARVAVEAGVGLSWHRYVGESGKIISIERFGASAPYKVIYKEFKITPEAVAEAALAQL